MRGFSPSAILAAALIVLVSAVLNGPAAAQSPNVQGPAMAIGQSPYAIYNNPADIDHVNPVTGNIFISIPLLSYPQVGKDLRFQFNIYYNDKQWYIPNLAPSPQNNGDLLGAWSWYDTTRSSQMDTIGAYVARDQHLDFGQDDAVTSQTLGETFTACTYVSTTFGFWVRGADGAKHYYGDNSSQTNSGPGCNSQGDPNPYGLAGNIYPASDETGYTPANGSYVSGSTQVRDASGVLYTSNGVTGETVSDTNGNSIISTASGSTDSLGKTIPGSTSLPGFSDNAGPSSAQDPVPGVPTSVGGTECPAGTTSARDWAVPAEGGATEHYYLCYSAFTFQTAFNMYHYNTSYSILEVSSSDQNSRPALLLSAVVLPNHTSYTFSYDQYLSLAQLGLPTGGSIAYTWQTIYLGSPSAPVTRALHTRTVNDGNGNAATWTYNWQLNETTNSAGGITTATPYFSIITDPLHNDTEHEFDNTFTEIATMQYAGCGPHDTFGTNCSPSPGTLMKSVSYVQTQIVSSAADAGSPSRQQGILYRPTTIATTTPVGGGNIVTKIVSTLTPPYGAPCATYTGFGNTGPLNLNQQPSPCSQYPQTASVATYAYGSSGPGSVMRTDTTTYKWQTTGSYLTANLFNLPSSIVRTDANGSRMSETDYGYDESGSPSGARGNQTSVTRILSGGNVINSTVYNSQGMPIQTYDPKHHETTISYQCSGAFPQNIVTPYGSTTTVVEATTYGYDCTTGEITSKKDPNNQITSYSYNDSLNRLTGVGYPDGGSLMVSYGDTSVPLSVTTTQATGEATGPIQKQTQYDGLGREIHKILMSDMSGQDYVDTTYDLLGRMQSVSNPHRPSSPVSTEDGTTSFAYDALGRKVIQTQPDGSTEQWCYGGIILNGQTDCTSGNTANATGKNQEWTDFFDETRRHSQETTDPLGRLTTAMEPDSSGLPKWKTDYNYDALDNLVMLSQYGASGNGVVARSFSYDALGRLTNACNPETVPLNGSHCSSSGPWSQSYSYDADGNVMSRTDSRGIATNYKYDDLDRVTAKNYSDGKTLSAYNYYDATICGNPPDNPVGRLTYSWTSPSTTNVGPSDPNQVALRCDQYDPMGRDTGWDIGFYSPGAPVDGYDGGSSIKYDLAGNVSTYLVGPNGPNGTLPYHGFDYKYDAAGRLLTMTLDQSLSLGVPSSIPTTIFNAAAKGGSPAYSAMGLEHAEISENAPGQPVMFYDHSFMNRGWPKSGTYTTGSGAVGGAGAVPYSYTLGYIANGLVGYAGDSIVGTISTETVDNVNRLTSAQYTSGPYNGLNLSWTYDAFGNRLTQTVSGSPSVPVPSSQWAHYNASNHVTSSSISPAGLQYDSAGNVLYDGVNQYVYDAENHLCAVKIGSLEEAYVYDVQGNRIGKGTISPPQGAAFDSSLCNPMTPSNNFVMTDAYNIDPDGLLVEAYKANNVWHNTNVFTDGRLIATYASNYMDVVMTDWLGTRRAKLPNNSSPSQMTEFLSLPFGDGYTMVGGNGVTDTSLFFTGKQHDADTGLENFVARYLSSSTGRFMSPDWGGVMGDSIPDPVPWADFQNPQSLNLYSYGYNNPLSNKDADGHDVKVCTTVGAGIPECNTITNDQYLAGQFGNLGLNVPTLNQVGMNGNGSGQFYATNITDTNNNVVGTATYIPDNEATDYYANRVGIGVIATASRGVNQVTAVAGAVYGAAAGAAVIGGAGAAPASGLIEQAAAYQRFLSLRSAWTALSKATGAAGLIGTFFKTGQVPPGLTSEMMQSYLSLARAYIAAGLGGAAGLAEQTSRVERLEQFLGR